MFVDVGDCMQSFQVGGPQNREISPFIENRIGRFFTGTFQGGKTVRNSCYHVIISIRPAAYTELQLDTLTHYKIQVLA